MTSRHERAARTISPGTAEREVEDPERVRGPDASQPFLRTQHPESEGGAGQGSRASPQGIHLHGGGPPCAHRVLASVGQAVWQASRPVPAGHPPLPLTRGQLDLAPAVRGLLLRMSPATCDRLLQDVRTKEEPWEHPHPRPGMLLLRQVPVQTAAEWDRTRPGFVAVDLVTHEGSIAGGEYACTLDVTDVATGWTETRAVRNKSQEQVFAALRGIRSNLPFPLLGIHSDNGSEFMNNHLIRYCHQEHITLTRSRPYRKNDNCFVEQKNWSIVRRTVWYLRYDTEEEVLLMNRIYQSLRLFTNFFLPVMQLTHKTRQGAKVTRSYDTPCSPYERVLASPCITEEAKEALRAQYQCLDPVALHDTILADERHLRDLVLTKKQVQPHIIPRKARGWQIHPVSSRF